MEWMERLLADPTLPHTFLTWLIFVNSLAVFFVFRHFAARAMLGVWLINLVLVDLILGEAAAALSHVLLWTPLLVWLAWRNPDFAVRSPLGIWLMTAFASNLVGLATGLVTLLSGGAPAAMLAGL